MAWRQIVTHNFGWKVLSVVLAALTWAMLRTGLPPTLQTNKIRKIADVPVAVLSPTGEARDYQVKPAEVAITVRGGQDLIQNLLPSDIGAFVSVAMTTNNPAFAQWRRILVSLPPGVQFVRAEPADVSVRIVPVDTSATNSDSP